MSGFFQRIRAFFARLLRREVLPGRFEKGTRGTWRGWLAAAPRVLPRRDYVVYVPRGHSRWRRYPIVVLCHGCKQSPEEFAAATRIAEVADREGWLVLMPRQKEAANPWRCWNWFDTRTARGAGEAAIVVAQLDAVRREYRGDRARVVLAGLSAGGALAAAVALRHPDRVRGVFVHSGLACGAASGPLAAMSAMQRGPDRDTEAIARDARRALAPTRPLPLCVLHGSDDAVVSPVNAIALVRQFLRLNDHPALSRNAEEPATHVLPPADRESIETLAGQRRVTVREWRDGPQLVLRYVSVAGLGHAWSGGDPQYPYNDPAPPAATELLARFVADLAP
jgi:poly(3-hydroxybutyrate) depolymerase